MKNNLKVIIAIVGAVVLAAAFPFLLWKLASHNGAAQPAGAGPGHYLTRKQVAFVGYATPEATLQTLAWAAVNGDSDKAFACFSPEAQAYFNSKPNGRRMYDADIKEDGQLLKGLQITSRKVLADDKVELKYKVDAASLPKNGGPLPDFFVQPMVKICGEWKLNGPNKPYTPDWDNGSQPEPAAP